MKVGIIFGCFIPWHIGHQYLYSYAVNENDHVIVAVCGHPSDRGENFIPFYDRCKLVKSKFEDYKNTTVCEVNDDLCGCDGSFSIVNWKNWSNLLFYNAGFNLNENEYAWYTGEKLYADSLMTIFPKHSVTYFDRHEIPISGTLIRSNPEKYLDSIDTKFVEYLKTKGRVMLHA